MTLRPTLLACAALSAMSVLLPACAAERLTVTASHKLDIARPAETIAIPWSQVNEALPHALIQSIVVKDAAGRVLPYQVTNVAPQAKDPKMVGAAYGELLFQYDFKAGEKSASFTVEKAAGVAPPFPVKAYARYIPERLDDFAWENDKIAHRTYGPALGAPAAPGSGKEVLVTSGIDIWFKRVPYPIVDRWYTIGHDHYHVDEGEGMDMYNVGPTRGAGGTGIWDGKTLFVGANYKNWKVVTNGPVRAVFELSYDSWDAAGTRVSELKRFTIDAGRHFTQVDTTFSFSGQAKLTAAIGLNKRPSDKGQEAKVDIVENRADGTLVQWVAQRSLGDFGVALIVPKPASVVFAEDERNALVTTPVEPGKPLRYYIGAAWTRGSAIASQTDWKRHVAEEAARRNAPVTVNLSSGR